MDPIFFGDYPQVMHERLGDKLPKFSQEERDLLQNSIDFIGLNHYTTRYIAHSTENPEEHEYYAAQEIERIGNAEFLRTLFLFIFSSYISSCSIDS